MWLKIFKTNKMQGTAEEKIKIDSTVEVDTIQEITTGITAGMVTEITTTGTEAEIVETIVEIGIETEAGEETDLIQEKEEETSLDLDQVKDTLTEIIFAVSAIKLVI